MAEDLIGGLYALAVRRKRAHLVNDLQTQHIIQTCISSVQVRKHERFGLARCMDYELMFSLQASHSQDIVTWSLC